MNLKTCPSCHSIVKGKYCGHCGEKQVTEKDFNIWHILSHGFSFFTHLDSKLYRTIKGLLFQPGHLPMEYIRGKRQAYMKPFQVFVLSSILFYLFMSQIDLLLVPSKWFFTTENEAIVQSIMTEKSMTKDAVAEIYDQKVVSHSKLFVFILLPFLAMMVYLFNFRVERQFGKHFLFVVYLLSFFMVMTTIIIQLMELLPVSINKWVYIYTLEALFVIYLCMAIMHMFKRKWWIGVLQSGLITLVFGFMLGSYRYGVSYYTLNSLLE